MSNIKSPNILLVAQNQITLFSSLDTKHQTVTQLATLITSSRPRTDHLPIHIHSRSRTRTVNARAVTEMYKYQLVHGWSWNGTREGRTDLWEGETQDGNCSAVARAW
jgi:hypothetical protein